MKKKKTLITIPIILAGMIMSFYLCFVFYYHSKFMPNTMIGSYNVSCMSEGKAAELIKEDMVSNYQIGIKDISGRVEYLKGDDIDLDLQLPISVFKENENSYLWFTYLFKETNYPLEYKVVYSESKLESALASMSFFKEENMELPQNAYISEYIEGNGYQIIEETPGSTIDIQKVYEEVRKTVESLSTQIILEDIDCYVKADVTKESAELRKTAEYMNQALAGSITYDLGDETFILDADTFHKWLSFPDETLIIDDLQVSEFVSDLAKKVDTVYTTRTFTKTSGETVDVTGPYGYQLSKDEEMAKIIETITNGETIEREPIYTKSGALKNGHDYGDTYVEIDLTNQRVYLYIEGNLIKSSECVTGNVSKDYTTPPGIYPMTYKQKDAVLRGPGYASPVKFWMPFNGGIGLHDASWRSSFGGEIYKTNGSHGCVNLPYDMAKTIYENAYAGMPVICYN